MSEIVAGALHVAARAVEHAKTSGVSEAVLRLDVFSVQALGEWVRLLGGDDETRVWLIWLDIREVRLYCPVVVEDGGVVAVAHNVYGVERPTPDRDALPLAEVERRWGAEPKQIAGAGPDRSC